MLKKIVLAFCLLAFFAQIAFAETVFERSFSEMGYAEFAVVEPGSSACTSFDFIFPSDKNVFANENYPIFSLNADFLPAASEAATIDVNLNNAALEKIKSNELTCSEGQCWSRINLPKNLLENSKNTLEICLNSSNTTPEIVLKNSSKIGIYKTADFSELGFFSTTSEKETLVIGDRTKITVVLHNGGSAPVSVELKYARPIAEEKNAFAFIEGNAYATGTVKPGENLKLEYTIKPRVLESITLPPAAAYFTNEFGEQKVLFSGLATINVRAPDKKIDGFIEKQKEINKLGETAQMTLNIKNNGRDFVYNLIVSLDTPDSVSIAGEKTQTINLIAPGETVKIPLQATASAAGSFDIGCKITYVDLNMTEAKCTNSKLVFEPAMIGPEIIAAIILVIIGICVYVYLMKSK